MVLKKITHRCLRCPPLAHFRGTSGHEVTSYQQQGGSAVRRRDQKILLKPSPGTEHQTMRQTSNNLGWWVHPHGINCQCAPEAGMISSSGRGFTKRKENPLQPDNVLTCFCHEHLNCCGFRVFILLFFLITSSCWGQNWLNQHQQPLPLLQFDQHTWT